MNFKALIAVSTASLLLAGAAAAQDAPAQAPAPAAQAPEFSDDQVSKFASILVGIDEIRAANPNADTDPQAKAQMAGVIENSGLSFETYNAIATRMSADEDLNHRIAQHMPDDDADTAD